MPTRTALELEFVSDVNEKMNRALGFLNTIIRKDADEVVTSVGFDLLRRIQMKTPVRTGRARASWHLIPPNSGRDPFGAYRDRLGHSFSGTLEGVRTGPGEAVVGSNVVYMPALEAGHSRQAPNGMVAVSMLEILGQMELKISERIGARWLAF